MTTVSKQDEHKILFIAQCMIRHHQTSNEKAAANDLMLNYAVQIVQALGYASIMRIGVRYHESGRTNHQAMLNYIEHIIDGKITDGDQLPPTVRND
jgi:hypothetical protein